MDSIHCGLCGTPTMMTYTKRCDRCWELEGRIRRDPELAAKILASNGLPGPNDEQVVAAKRWAALMLMDPMDIVTVAMGAPTINEFMREMEQRADRLLKRIGATGMSSKEQA